ncbi:hypothetical protein C4F40_20440 [Sphingobacterium sp. Ka21]|uniref:DinB-like domain-containing protein n=1 Tax=Sphingobacterium pedocola TaxID=2082722 RepID=A0ABR9TCT3_9SPHI|nr:hypothetical protein [Sphingobacterium pedocola]
MHLNPLFFLPYGKNKKTKLNYNCKEKVISTIKNYKYAPVYEYYSDCRQPVIDYIRKADAKDLRNHINDYPTGVVDGYQGLMFIAAHCARHTKQIEEIKADTNFPKQ